MTVLLRIECKYSYPCRAEIRIDKLIYLERMQQAFSISHSDHLSDLFYELFDSWVMPSELVVQPF